MKDLILAQQTIEANCSIKINTIWRYPLDPPSYSLDTPYGLIHFPRLIDMMTQEKFRITIAESIGKLPGKCKPKEWESVKQAFLDLCQDHYIGAEERLGKILRWVESYLDYQGKIENETKEALLFNRPYFNNNTLVISAKSLTQFVKATGEVVTYKEMIILLAEIGAKPLRKDIRIDNQKTTRRLWEIPWMSETLNVDTPSLDENVLTALDPVQDAKNDHRRQHSDIRDGAPIALQDNENPLSSSAHDDF